MSDFRQKLRKEVVDPALNAGRKSTLIAMINDKSKISGSYKISFANINGEQESKSGISARQYNKDKPTVYEVGNHVLVEYEGDKYEIISLYEEDQDASRANFQLKADVYSNLISDVLPGYIF